MVMKYQSDEELAQDQGLDPITGKPLSSAPGGSLTTGTPPVQKPNETSGGGGTGFTSITQYLEQNRPQAAKLASQVGQFVTDKGEAARSQINTAQGQFESQSAPVELDKDLLNKAVTTPSDVLGNEADLAKFNTMKSAEYTGPTSLEAADFFPDVTKSIEAAKTAGEETTSTTGQRNLLTEMAKTPNITPGMTSLNQLLLANPEARTALGTAREGLSDLDTRLSTASEAAKARAEASKLATQDTAGAVQKALEERYQTFQNEVAAKEAEAEAKAQADILAYQNILKSTSVPTDLGGINPEYMGLNQAALLDIINKNTGLPSQYRTDLSQYFSALNPEVQISRENAASPEDYAMWAALNQLSGGPDNYGGQYGFLPDEYTGAYNPDMVNFDTAAAQAAMMAQYRAAIQAKLDAYNASQEGAQVQIGYSPQTYANLVNPYSAWAGVDLSKSSW